MDEKEKAHRWLIHVTPLKKSFDKILLFEHEEHEVDPLALVEKILLKILIIDELLEIFNSTH